METKGQGAGRDLAAEQRRGGEEEAEIGAAGRRQRWEIQSGEGLMQERDVEAEASERYHRICSLLF